MFIALKNLRSSLLAELPVKSWLLVHHVGYAILAILEVDCSNAGHHHLEILEPYKGREHGAFLGSVQWEQEVSDNVA